MELRDTFCVKKILQIIGFSYNIYFYELLENTSCTNSKSCYIDINFYFFFMNSLCYHHGEVQLQGETQWTAFNTTSAHPNEFPNMESFSTCHKLANKEIDNRRRSWIKKSYSAFQKPSVQIEARVGLTYQKEQFHPKNHRKTKMQRQAWVFKCFDYLKKKANINKATLKKKRVIYLHEQTEGSAAEAMLVTVHCLSSFSGCLFGNCQKERKKRAWRTEGGTHHTQACSV